MKKTIITISREFGSGGRTIAKKLAEKLGYDYLDKEIIEQVAQKSGYNEKFIEQYGEHSPSANIFSYSFLGRDDRGMSSSDHIWALQREVILDYAKKGNCVIVGRCADFILSEEENVLNVFIHADINFRQERVVKEYGETDCDSKSRVLKKDKTRAINYKYYTDQKWGESTNYHITLDSSYFGIDNCVEILEKLASL